MKKQEFDALANRITSEELYPKIEKTYYATLLCAKQIEALQAVNRALKVEVEALRIR
jgi:hypothetical protein